MYTCSDPNIYIKPKTTNVAGCTRNSLNVVASDKGVVVGRVKFLEDGVYTYPPLLLFCCLFPFCNAYLFFSLLPVSRVPARSRLVPSCPSTPAFAANAVNPVDKCQLTDVLKLT